MTAYAALKGRVSVSVNVNIKSHNCFAKYSKDCETQKAQTELAQDCRVWLCMIAVEAGTQCCHPVVMIRTKRLPPRPELILVPQVEPSQDPTPLN